MDGSMCDGDHTDGSSLLLGVGDRGENPGALPTPQGGDEDLQGVTSVGCLHSISPGGFQNRDVILDRLDEMQRDALPCQ